jgi:hypothetical protein
VDCNSNDFKFSVRIIMIKNVTCHTDGCENKDIVIPFEDPADIVICGPCGIQIEDVIPVGS